MTEAGLEHTQANEQPFREELRAREGKDFVVNRIVKQLRGLIDAGQHRIIADGIYTWTEYKIMKREFPGELTTVAVVAPKHLRHHRLTMRPVRPLTEAEANQRDWAEIENLEKGGPIAIADTYIINDGNLDRFHQQIDDELARIDF
jgi:dephospho-CoA kinase